MGWVSIIREWVNFSANICILLITIYTFYITFISCKIKFLSISESHPNNNENSFSVVIENKSFSTLVVTKVSLIVNNEYKGFVIGMLNIRFEEQLHHSKRIAEILEFAVVSAYRNKGIGKEMFAQSCQIATDNSCSQIEVACTRRLSTR